MSVQTAIAKLKSPVKELVLGFTQDGTRHIGQTEQDRTEVVGWIEKTAAHEAVTDVQALKVRNISISGYMRCLESSSVFALGSLWKNILRRGRILLVTI